MRSQIALFLLRGQYFSLSVEEILIILQEPKVFALPLLPPAVAGTLVHNGEAVLIMNPDRFLAASAAGHASFPYVVACSTEAGVVGLPADKILHIVDRHKGRLEINQDTVGGASPDRTFIYAQVRYPMVDIGSIVSELSLWDFRHPPPQGH